MAESLKIRDIPIDSRPREAFMRSGNPIREISDEILLAILIRTGRKGSNAIDVANRLRYFGTTRKLVEAGWQQILAAHVSGIGKVAAVHVDKAYGKKFANDTERVAHLFDLYAAAVCADGI